MRRAFQSGGIPESGTEVVDLMTKKPSRFSGGNAYATVRQCILNGPKVFYVQFFSPLYISHKTVRIFT